ncbi:hypothetical protein HPB50_006500 [Hyalomma asiaticum]|uniref:Uncharacterized protein n=1 Tax=Hyalomma asiaticum TaxID=266040 RepID=A0ACB7TFU3_HYAAI|nr:hypothetical protein HPB50_006500 [Hyalomma asiaticum]
MQCGACFVKIGVMWKTLPEPEVYSVMLEMEQRNPLQPLADFPCQRSRTLCKSSLQFSFF